MAAVAADLCCCLLCCPCCLLCWGCGWVAAGGRGVDEAKVGLCVRDPSGRRWLVANICPHTLPPTTCHLSQSELEEIVAYLKDPRKFTSLGGKLPKGVLLVGPPGECQQSEWQSLAD